MLKETKKCFFYFFAVVDQFLLYSLTSLFFHLSDLLLHLLFVFLSASSTLSRYFLLLPKPFALLHCLLFHKKPSLSLYVPI